MSIDTLSFQRVTLLNQPGGARFWNRQATPLARNYMHSILLVIPRPEKSEPNIEQVWRSVVPGLQQRATQTRCVKTLCENCRLIPAAENGFLFFDHAITIADSVKLRCRICLLRTPPNGFVCRSSNTRLELLSGATVRAFQGTARLVRKLLAWRGLAC